ncbi:unnamed protein product [Didymodactylos carnosus]|uniref:Uncharacterized protein n=2 Tax=Didymodactylos carnosus TaxID=1234261 RepID=A0A8S2CZ13_9BILA|nr:unnamed protein product [Didymodactylos carnosus]CAF3544696.1 unnamed protein product [Didymodactylos carnosus]
MRVINRITDSNEKKIACETLLDCVVKLLRQSIDDNNHYFKKLKQQPELLANFTSGLYWDFVPLILKNFIGLVTVNERKFDEMKRDYIFYDALDKDLFKSSKKWLKISSQTITRLHKQSAAQVSSSSCLPKTVQHHLGFGIKVADNFDLNKETIHGKNSIHIMNQIIIQTAENDEVVCSVRECLDELSNTASDRLELSVISDASMTTSGALINSAMATTTNSLIMNNYLSYEPFVDESFKLVLVAYGLMKYVFNNNNLTQLCYNAFVRRYPKTPQTAAEVKQTNSFGFQYIAIYAGDFHVIKNYMIVVWDVLNESVSSKYLLQRLSRSFAVNRTHRPFSSIAMDQTIECTINKLGKGSGGISGRFSQELIDVWTNSFTYRSLMTGVTHEIAGLETANNTIDSHAECTPRRLEVDDEDLTTIICKLTEENLFTCENEHCRKLLSGKIIHDDIIDNICTSYERGLEALKTYIQERFVMKLVQINMPLKAMRRLCLRDADSYVPGIINTKGNTKFARNTKNSNNNIQKILKTTDEDIRRFLVLSEYRNLDLTYVFSHEFTSAPLTLCDHSNFDFMNQQKKSTVLDFLREEFPIAFSTVDIPIATEYSALVIDGGSMLEIKPVTRHGTVHNYAIQLLKSIIIPQFQLYQRTDVVFDSSESKTMKSYTKRHGNDKNQPIYDLKSNDILETSYHDFIHGNR